MAEPHGDDIGTIRRERIYNILVETLSTLLSGRSRFLHSDGRTDHRMYTPRRLVRQQLDRFSYETTAIDTKPRSRFQEWMARLQAVAEHITRMGPRCYRSESRSTR